MEVNIPTNHCETFFEARHQALYIYTTQLLIMTVLAAFVLF
jgi:hypothetical protein